MSATATRPPSAASAREVASPIPLAPPVTTHTLSATRPAMSPPLTHGGASEDAPPVHAYPSGRYSPSLIILPIVSYLARLLDFRYIAYPMPPTKTITSIATSHQA